MRRSAARAKNRRLQSCVASKTDFDSLPSMIAPVGPGIVAAWGIAMLFSHGGIVVKMLSKRHQRALVLCSPQRVARLEKAGHFPKRVQLGPNRGRTGCGRGAELAPEPVGPPRSARATLLIREQPGPASANPVTRSGEGRGTVRRGHSFDPGRRSAASPQRSFAAIARSVSQGRDVWPDRRKADVRCRRDPDMWKRRKPTSRELQK